MTVLPVIRDIRDPAQVPARHGRRARSTAISREFRRPRGVCEQHIGWMADYSAYHDTIRRLEENDEGIVD